VYRLEHGDGRKMFIVGEGTELPACIPMKSNHSEQREAKEYSRGQRAQHSHSQSEI
jgi:hypothetical protein